MNEYPYHKIDTFTSGKSSGNPAACIYLKDSQSLTEQEMQEIARQHKGFVSEVIYCRNVGRKHYGLAYYSSECEVDFCGHGTIACMYSLIKGTPDLSEEKEIMIHTVKKGAMTVYNKIAEQDAVYITAPVPVYHSCSISREQIAKHLGVEEAQISVQYPIELVNAGLNTLIVPITSLGELTIIYPKEQSLKQFCLENVIDIILIFTMETDQKDCYAHTRVFAPKFGYLEDPATGSGNSAFGYYMKSHSMWGGSPITIEQGGSDITYNSVKLEYTDNRLLFGGSATERIVGKYLMP
ncbi:MAG TPA: PhzF family phenazine biosynthesis isomerase [Mobilitalea sp.]|nr:PhzF family phenazine biosynthesis isomerase [Mobilitalea sp.]